MIVLFALFGLTGVGLYVGACLGVGALYLAVRFAWVLAGAGLVVAIAARSP